jgi:hypothetical protein
VALIVSYGDLEEGVGKGLVVGGQMYLGWAS